ncbi:BatA domain-containing protein [Bacteroidota bacterium]
MVFLNPAVLFGLFAASIPILIHLLNLRKLKKIEFSTLYFLKELQKTKIKRLKLKQWILLALRILLILCLVSAFARPTIKSVSFGNVSSAAKTTAVFILDNSFSMNVITDQGTYLNKAKQIAKNILREFQEGDEAVILLTSSVKRNVKPVSNLEELIDKIDNVQYSNVTEDLHQSVIIGSDILDASQNYNKELYILSDFQKDLIYNFDEQLDDLGKALNENVKIYVFDLSTEEVTNLAVTDFVVNNQIFEKNKLISFTATVSNKSGQVLENVVASLFINDKRSSQSSINFNPGESKQINFESTLAFSGLVEASVHLEDDDILQDNIRYLSFNVPEKISVVLFADEISDLKFIETALNRLSEDNFEITQKNLSQIASINLVNYDAVVIVGSEKVSNYSAIQDYLIGGGSLIIMPGENSTVATFKNLCGQLELSFPVEKIVNEENSFISFEKVDFDHPVFSDLFNTEINPIISSPDIYIYFRLSIEGNGRKVISLINDNSFLSEYNRGNGRVFLFNIAPVLSWSDFPLKGIFAPLINKSLFYLTSRVKKEENYFAGDEITVNLRDRALSQINIVKPDNTEEFIEQDPNNLSNIIKYGNSEILGVYKVYSLGNIIDYFYVNADPRESSLDYLNLNDFEDYFDQINFKGKLLQLPVNGNYKESIYQARFGTELWKYFLLAALIIALIEMSLARNTKKEITSIVE